MRTQTMTRRYGITLVELELPNGQFQYELRTNDEVVCGVVNSEKMSPGEALRDILTSLAADAGPTVYG